MKTLISTILLLLIGIIAIFYLKTVPLTNDYLLFNEKNEKINGNVFINTKTINGEKTKELIIFFKDSKKTKFLTVAVPPKLIGYPEQSSNIKVINNRLYLPDLMFTPINAGPDILINQYIVSDSLIYFNTFNDLKQFGSKIILKKL